MRTNPTNLRDSITSAAEAAGLGQNQFRSAGPHKWFGILNRVSGAFLERGDLASTDSWWWERLSGEPVSFVPENAAGTIGELVAGEQSAFLILENPPKRWVFEVDPSVVAKLLGESVGIDEYYVVDTKLRWLVAENHHGVVVATGAPMEESARRLKAAV